MRPKLFRPLLAVALAAVIVGVGAPSAPAEHPIEPPLVDAGVAVASIPPAVDPPGSHVVYRVTASNEGTLGITVTVTNTVPDGFTVTGVPEGCTADSGAVTVTCSNIALVAGDSRTFDIVAKSGPTIGKHIDSAEVSVDFPLSPLDQHSPNDTATATTDVEDDDGAAAFVPPGGTLVFGNHFLTVPNNGNGVFTEMSTLDGSGLSCGGGGCGTGVLVEYGSDDDYQYEDPTEPITVDVGFDYPPCKGIGNDSCVQVYALKVETGPDPVLVKKCDGAGTGDQDGRGHAFVSGQYQICKDRVYKVGGRIRQEILMISTDPGLIPNLG